MFDDEQFGQIRIVGKISLWFSLVVVVGLIAVVLMAGTPKESYSDSVQALALTRKNLPWVMLMGGLLLALGTALTTWLITVYSSFRVAGPLYRFARNLETGIRLRQAPRIRIRQSDYLQEESELLEQTFLETEYYRHNLSSQVGQVIRLLEQPGPIDRQVLDAQLEKLKAMQGRTRHDPVN